MEPTLPEIDVSKLEGYDALPEDQLPTSPDTPALTDDVMELGTGDVLPEPDADLCTGLVLAKRYTLNTRLGSGASGVVFLARDNHMGRDVVIKILSEAVSEQKCAEEIAHRFNSEAAFTATLSHPNIITVFDKGTYLGRPYLVMEALEAAKPLNQVFKDARSNDEHIPLPQLQRWLEGVAAGLTAVHRKDGAWHRDIKPDNLLAYESGDGRPGIKIIDFGIAHLPNSERTQLKNVYLGTPQYMAPEVLQADMVTGERLGGPRSDLYALGVTFYRLLTLERPFPADLDAHQIHKMQMVDGFRPKPPSTIRDDVPPGWDHLIGRLMEPNVDKRVQSAAELSELLKNLETWTPLDDAPHLPDTVAQPAESLTDAAPSIVRRVANALKPQPTPTEPTATTPRGNPAQPDDPIARRALTQRMALGFVFAAVVLVGTLGAIFLVGDGDDPAARSLATAAGGTGRSATEQLLETPAARPPQPKRPSAASPTLPGEGHEPVASAVVAAQGDTAAPGTTKPAGKRRKARRLSPWEQEYRGVVLQSRTGGRAQRAKDMKPVRGARIRATIQHEVGSDIAGARVLAVLGAPQKVGELHLPAKTEAHGAVAGAANQRILITFGYFVLPSGKQIDFVGKAYQQPGRIGIAATPIVDKKTGQSVATNTLSDIANAAAGAAGGAVGNVAGAGIQSAARNASGTAREKLDTDETVFVSKGGEKIVIWIDSIGKPGDSR